MDASNDQKQFEGDGLESQIPARLLTGAVGRFVKTQDLPQTGAQIIRSAFDAYQFRFREITHRAQARFENCDWHGMYQDALKRLDVREHVIRQAVADIHQVMGKQAKDKTVWAAMKTRYLELVNCRINAELAETFYSSVTRRIFATEGVDLNVEFVDSEFDCPGPDSEEPIERTYPGGDSTETLCKRILADYEFGIPFQDCERDARLVANAIDTKRDMWGGEPIERIEMARPVFYRNKGAYLIGRIRCGTRLMPLVLALLNTGDGIYVDAALLDEDDVSIVFSFTRSYFQVEVERPSDLVMFLHSIMPAKRIAELYISIGFNKHGKTELYRDLMRHLETSSDPFVRAPGERGMVMLVFALESYDLVFKVIRDQFPYPKSITRQEVMDKYALVFKHDRAGRLVDAQEFEHLAFPRDRFSEELFAELLETAASSVTVREDTIIIHHLYIERRVTPLNLYLRLADRGGAREGILDYGQAIKDLAATNIFPGDLLLKNFGVTRHGRVIFYDYDELTLLSECNFREMPAPQNIDDELAAEPWFYVGPMDIFPEEFINFLGLHGELREEFVQAHGDILRPEFWVEMQARHARGEIVDLFPYPRSRSLHP